MRVYFRSIVAATAFAWVVFYAPGTPRAGAQPAPAAQSGDKASSPGEERADAPAGKDKSAATAADKLALEQQRIADKYKHLEQLMLQMAELSVQTDPRRAALLKKALAQSKEQLIGMRIERLIEFLGSDQLSRAIENQKEVDQDLRGLLDLLLSENRAKRIQSEKARLREYLKRLGSILKQEKEVQSRTAEREDAARLALRQGKIADETGGLAKDIKTNEEGGEQNAQDRAQGEKSKPEGGKPAGQSEKKPDSSDKTPENAGGKAEEQKGKSEGGSKPENEQGQSQDGQDAQNPQFGDERGNPARRRLEAAQRRMQAAREKLEKARHQDAAKDQEDAIRELEQAKAQLEQILRQLREEESERVLAMLEARFRKMLELEREVYEGTIQLDKVPAAERTHNHEIEASRLSAKQLQNVVEADKALLILREDGTTAAFAEAADQMRTDMQQIVDRLAQAKVGQVTQAIELDVIATLEEMIAALKKAQKDLEKSRQKPKLPGTQGRQGEPSLVDKLAELKMIRALQMRINTRTQRYATLVEGEQAENAELVDALKRLAERQQRVYRVTHDLSSGKTE